MKALHHRRITYYHLINYSVHSLFKYIPKWLLQCDTHKVTYLGKPLVEEVIIGLIMRLMNFPIPGLLSIQTVHVRHNNTLSN